MPSFFRAQDTQPMLDDFGVPVTIAGVTAKCIIRDSDEEVAASASSVLVGRAIVADAVLATFPGAVEGAAATADYPAPGTDYKVIGVRRKGTGERADIWLAKV